MNKDTESQPTTTEEGGEKSPKQSLQMTNTSDDVTKDTNDNQDKDQLKQPISIEGETIEVVRKSSQKPFIVTKISEEENCEEKIKDSFENDPSTKVIEDTSDETQSLLDKTEEEEEPEKKKKGVTLNVAPLATGELDTESMPATPRDPTINSKEQVDIFIRININLKEQVPLLEWEPKEEEVKNLLKSWKVEPVHVVRTVDGTKTQISFCVPFDQVRLPFDQV